MVKYDLEKQGGTSPERTGPQVFFCKIRPRADKIFQNPPMRNQMNLTARTDHTSLSEDTGSGTLKKSIPSSFIVFSSCSVLTPRIFLGSETP